MCPEWCVCVIEKKLTSQELGYRQVHAEAHESGDDSQSSITVPLQPSQREQGSLNTPYTPCLTWYKSKILFNFRWNFDYSHIHIDIVSLWWITYEHDPKARASLQEQIIKKLSKQNRSSPLICDRACCHGFHGLPLEMMIFSWDCFSQACCTPCCSFSPRLVHLT